LPLPDALPTCADVSAEQLSQRLTRLIQLELNRQLDAKVTPLVQVTVLQPLEQ
ncbi:MAG: hypothetical protein F6J97_26280, partial [Leptolyngbya sp. SIO4C1]|nr:hypothetical protein [Leptolyngbya sp. SIO4C1]